MFKFCITTFKFIVKDKVKSLIIGLKKYLSFFNILFQNSIALKQDKKYLNNIF